MDEDLWPEIFKRLPIESLCRFRCVCKRWNSIISSASFINLHFTFTPRNLKPYLHVAYRDRAFYPPFHSLYHTSHERYTLCHPLENDDDNDNNNQQQQLYFPFRAVDEDVGDLKKFTFVDIIHGVVCISQSSCASNPFFHSIYLWNASIHKYVALPRLILTRSPYFGGAIGFGYDNSKNDFKVVVISLTSISTALFKVYSAQQGRWRHPRVTHLDPNRSLVNENITVKNSCFVNGTIHWLLERVDSLEEELDYSVLMFDCESEEVRRMDIPKEVSCSKYELVLFEYAGMLAALVRMHSSSLSSAMDLWVMEERGVSSSWKKLAPYGPSNLSTSILCDHVYNKSMFLMDHPKAQSYANQD